MKTNYENSQNITRKKIHLNFILFLFFCRRAKPFFFFCLWLTQIFQIELAAIPRGGLPGGRPSGPPERHQQLPGLQHRAAAVGDGRRRAPALGSPIPAGDDAQAGGRKTAGRRTQKPGGKRSTLKKNHRTVENLS